MNQTVMNIRELKERKTIVVDNEAFKSILFHFESGKGLPNHTHGGAASIQILSGKVDLTFVDGKSFVLNGGDILSFDAKVEHNVIASEDTQCLVTISK